MLKNVKNFWQIPNVNNVEMCQLLNKLLIVFVWLYKGLDIFKKRLVSFIKKLFLKMIMLILVINVRKKLKHRNHIELLLCHLIWSLFSRGLHILQQLAWGRKFMIDFSFLWITFSGKMERSIDLKVLSVTLELLMEVITSAI